MKYIMPTITGHLKKKLMLLSIDSCLLYSVCFILDYALNIKLLNAYLFVNLLHAHLYPFLWRHQP